jgi:hypothetical protein
LQTRFTGLLAHTGAQDDHAAPGKLFVTARSDIQGVSERYGMANIIGFGIRALDILID